MLIVPADSACAEGTAVASGIAVGAPPEDGASVAALAVVGDGVSPPVEGAGVAVAEDPQATRRAETNRINT